MPTWFMMGTKEKPFLLNLDVSLGVGRDEKTGGAIAFSITGAPLELGVPFDTVVDDLTLEPDETLGPK